MIVRSYRAMSAALSHSRSSRERLERFRDEGVRRLVLHAYRKVPFYRRLWDEHGVRPHDIRDAADLRYLPVVSKRELLGAPARDLVARGTDPQALIVTRTSGSTGEPFAIRRTWLEQNLLHLFRLRAFRSVGIGPRDRWANVTLGRATHPRDNKTIGRTLRFLGVGRKERVDLFAPPYEVLAQLRKIQPDVLSGFPGALARLASYATAADRSAIRPRLVLTGAEVLTPLMRRQIAEAFGAPVFDTYGSHEFNLLAWECAQTGDLHTCDDSLVLEVLRDGHPVALGERGEVIGTALHSYAMPFIRYRIGDVVTRGSERCPCGQPFSTIREVQGRMIDFFPLPDGRTIHPYEIVNLFVGTAAEWIAQYRLVQESRDRIELQVVPRSAVTDEQREVLRRAVEELLGPAVHFEIRTVAEIMPEPSGKFRVSRSLVHSDYDRINWSAPDPGAVMPAAASVRSG